MKLFLYFENGSLSGQTFNLESGFLTIGRGENCSVRFDPFNERIASKQHAFIEVRADGFYLTDNKSTNGTILNGEKIQTKKLNSGDVIQFGKNGSTAHIKIESIEFSSEPTVFSQSSQQNNDFREYQVQQFNQVAGGQKVSVQKSISQLGLGNLDATVQKDKTGNYIGIGLTLFGVIFLSFIVCLLIFASVGIEAAIVASIVAFIPAMFYILPLIWLDRYDPEPIWLLSLAFAWGALVAVVVSFIVNTLLGAIFGEVFGAVISAPIFEEGSKGLGLIVLLIFFRKYFDDILDGIVFAGVIALGFATVENVLYYGRAILQGKEDLYVLFFMRGILSPFAHVTFTAMTGIGCGIARESHNWAVKILLPIVGYICAVLLHALWNGMAVLGGFEGFALGYLFLEIPFFVLFVIFAFVIMYRQNKILKEMLAIDIARGLIPEKLAETATSAFKSSAWIIGGLFKGKFSARTKFVRAVGKLGLSYWHIQRATAAKGHTASFQQNPILREEVQKWREKV